jgi:Stress responsive A/B Barrel Domain
MTIVHIVAWRFKDTAEGASKADNLQKAKAMLMACANCVPGINAFEVSIAQPGFETTADMLLYSEFADQSALDAYQSHPDHLATKPFIGAVRLERHCFDYPRA